MSDDIVRHRHASLTPFNYMQVSSEFGRLPSFCGELPLIAAAGSAHREGSMDGSLLGGAAQSAVTVACRALAATSSWSLSYLRTYIGTCTYRYAVFL